MPKTESKKIKPCLYCGREPISVQPNGLGPIESVFCPAKSCLIFGMQFKLEAWNARPSKVIEVISENVAKLRHKLTAAEQEKDEEIASLLHHLDEARKDIAAAEKRCEGLEVELDIYKKTGVLHQKRIKELEGAALSKNHCISILAKCTADLWQAVVDGVYDSRELVGDTVLPMQESLLEIGIDVREKPLNTEALKG